MLCKVKVRRVQQETAGLESPPGAKNKVFFSRRGKGGEVVSMVSKQFGVISPKVKKIECLNSLMTKVILLFLNSYVS